MLDCNGLVELNHKDHWPVAAASSVQYNAPSQKVWCFLEYGDDFVRFITEEEILDIYWDEWYNRMVALERQDQISLENCIEDWVVTNWAWELE